MNNSELESRLISTRVGKRSLMALTGDRARACFADRNIICHAEGWIVQSSLWLGREKF